jgi:hypothetical protein
LAWSISFEKYPEASFDSKFSIEGKLGSKWNNGMFVQTLPLIFVDVISHFAQKYKTNLVLIKPQTGPREGGHLDDPDDSEYFIIKIENKLCRGSVQFYYSPSENKTVIYNQTYTLFLP